jgi:hypothetical protein
MLEHAGADIRLRKLSLSEEKLKKQLVEVDDDCWGLLRNCGSKLLHSIEFIRIDRFIKESSLIGKIKIPRKEKREPGNSSYPVNI